MTKEGEARGVQSFASVETESEMESQTLHRLPDSLPVQTFPQTPNEAENESTKTGDR
jgi:hypothetical protein